MSNARKNMFTITFSPAFVLDRLRQLNSLTAFVWHLNPIKTKKRINTFSSCGEKQMESALFLSDPGMFKR